LGDQAPRAGGDRERGDRDSGRGSRGDSGGRRGGRGGGVGGVLGKRRRDGESSEEEGEEIPEDVKCIPMPRDTPPPIPKGVLDKWYQKRREKWARDHPEQAAEQARSRGQNQDQRSGGTSANSLPLGANARDFGSGAGGGENSGGQRREIGPAQTTYEAKPIIRDLRKEAVSFVPAAVRQKLDKSKGVGGLVEPEEMDKLEKAGYIKAPGGEESAPRAVQMEEVEDGDD
jgi:hypothetical protein